MTTADMMAIKLAILDHYTNEEISERYGVSAKSVGSIRAGMTCREKREGRDRLCDCGAAKDPQDIACQRCSWLDGLGTAGFGRMVSELRALGGRASADSLAEELGIQPEGVLRNWYRFRGTQDRISIVLGMPHEPPVFVLNERRGVGRLAESARQDMVRCAGRRKGAA